jgi:hypothetical protein
MRRVRGLALATALLLATACSDDDSEAGSAGDGSSTTATDEPPSSAAGTDAPADEADACPDEEIVLRADFFAEPGDGVGAAPSIIGLADVDGDGNDELWATTGAGASASIIGLARRDGCELTRVLFETGEPAAFPVGGSVGSAAGVACETTIDPTAHLAAFTLSSIDGEEYEITTVEYALEGDTLVERANDGATVHADDPDFGRYNGFACGDLAGG